MPFDVNAAIERERLARLQELYEARRARWRREAAAHVWRRDLSRERPGFWRRLIQRWRTK